MICDEIIVFYQWKLKLKFGGTFGGKLGDNFGEKLREIKVKKSKILFFLKMAKSLQITLDLCAVFYDYD